MIRLKKLHLFLLLIIFTVIFFMIQLIFNIKISVTHFNSNHNIMNPRFNYKTNKQNILNQADSAVTKHNKISFISKQNRLNKAYKKVLKSELLVPLDYNNQPFLYNMLPFHHIINFKNFSHVNVESLVQVYHDFMTLDSKNTSQLTFVNIEDENKIKDKSILKDSDIVTSGNNVQLVIKGASLDSLHLYNPDSKGFFKCINSNVG
jgi:hypothetical protein